MNIEFKHGWNPDIPDKRDWKYNAKVGAVKPVTIPKIVNWKGKYTSHVHNQGQLGSCTANALVGAMEFLQIKARKNGNTKIPFAFLSRLFVYYNERDYEGSVDYDSGAYLRDGIKVLNKQGVCSDNKHQYDISKFTQKPSDAAVKEGLKHTIHSYYRLETLDDMKHCIADGFPFVFGFAVYSSFITREVALTGKVNLPGPRERLLGGHAVMAVGYDDTVGRINCRNSWGNNWGQEGYFTMPYEYVTDRDLSDDFWTIRDVANLAGG